MRVDYFDDEYDPLAPVFYSDEGEAGDDGLGDVPAADGFGAGRDVLAEREAAAREAAELAAARGGFLAFSRAAGEVVAVAQERVEQAQAGLGCLVGDDGGFGAGGLVRVWFDRGRRLERVRISPVWHRRLRLGWELAELLEHAFRRFALSLPPEVGLEPALVVPEDAARWSLDEYQRVLREHERQRCVAREVDGVGVAREVVGRCGGVSVSVDGSGLPCEVAFDEGWLDRVQVGVLCRAVLAAACDAQDRFVWVERVPARVARLGAEHVGLVAGLHRFIAY